MLSIREILLEFNLTTLSHWFQVILWCNKPDEFQPVISIPEPIQIWDVPNTCCINRNPSCLDLLYVHKLGTYTSCTTNHKVSPIGVDFFRIDTSQVLPPKRIWKLTVLSLLAWIRAMRYLVFLLAAFIFTVDLSVSFTILSTIKNSPRIYHMRGERKSSICAERSYISMIATREANGVLSFSSRLPIVVNLPTRNVDQAQSFLSNTALIVESTWEKSKLLKIAEGKYLFQFPTIDLPGFDSIAPAIEVQISYLPSEGTIRMVSSQWTLGGTGKGIKDSRFMEVSRWL